MTPHALRFLKALSLTAFAVALLACAPKPAPAPVAPAPVAAAAPAETPAQRGEYLVLVGGCDDCHTPGTMAGAADMKRRFSGSEIPWSGPWGTTYAKNLTSDPETGLGKWSEEQIYRVLRHGQRPDGSVLLPPMPWQRMAFMKDEDVRAIAAFLKTVPPVKHQSPAALPPGSPAPAGAVVFGPPSAWDVPPQAAAQ